MKLSIRRVSFMLHLDAFMNDKNDWAWYYRSMLKMEMLYMKDRKEWLSLVLLVQKGMPFLGLQW